MNYRLYSIGRVIGVLGFLILGAICVGGVASIAVSAFEGGDYTDHLLSGLVLSILGMALRGIASRPGKHKGIPNNGLGDYGDAINWLLDRAGSSLGPGEERDFLKSWREGDLDEWDEYRAFLAATYSKGK